MKKVLLSLTAAILAVAGLTGVTPAYALGETLAATNPAYTYLQGENSVNPGDLPSDGETSLMNVVKKIINAVIGVVGVIAVVMMIIGGISFITSQGDSNKVTKARNTILYGVVGLIVALLAFAIVNFVLSGIFDSSTTTGTSIWLSF